MLSTFLATFVRVTNGENVRRKAWAGLYTWAATHRFTLPARISLVCVSISCWIRTLLANQDTAATSSSPLRIVSIPAINRIRLCTNNRVNKLKLWQKWMPTTAASC